jgi:small subunit ribosomal protein S18
MTSKKNKARAPKETNKKFKKKTSVLLTDKVEFVDYKDVNLLNRFVSDRSKIRNRRVTGNTVQQQRDIANAVKNSREMALLPYTKRVSQTRAGRPPRDRDEDGGGRRERGERSDSFQKDAPATTAPVDAAVVEAAAETVEA